jgi:hypothetical protein
MRSSGAFQNGLRGIVEDEHVRLAVFHHFRRQGEDASPPAWAAGNDQSTFPRPSKFAEFLISRSSVHRKRRHLRCILT